MKYLCTICSREKSEEAGLIPASERYIAYRIKKVLEESKKQGLPLLFLSGKFGLISSTHFIPFYDKLLLSDDVRTIIPLVKKQMLGLDVTELVFYLDENDSEGWKPYIRTIVKCCEDLSVKLITKCI